MMEPRSLTTKSVQKLAHNIWFRSDAASRDKLAALYRDHKAELDHIARRDAILRNVLGAMAP